MKYPKSNKHEAAESKSYERREKKMKTEPEYRSDKSNYRNEMKKGYKGKAC